MAPLQWLLLGFSSVVKTPCFISSHNGVLLPVRSTRETSAWNPSVSFCDHPLKTLGTQHAHNSLYPKFSVHKKGDKIDCNNYRGISILPTTYKILSNILPSRLIPYAKEIIGDHQCGFQCNRSTIDHVFCIRQMLEKKWEYNEEVHPSAFYRLQESL